MEDFHLDGELTSMVTEDEDTNTTTTTLEGFGETGPELRLIDDGNGLLDITSLGHSNNSAILEVKDTILLEDRTQHGLDDNTWAWVRDERRLFVQLLGEEINSQVSVLAGSS
jgi:hypothetical protein